VEAPAPVAVVPILKSNPRGLLLERDELVGWVKAMDQYRSGGKGADRQFWLSTWSNRPVSVDRKSQEGPVRVLKPFVSVIGSIQPTVLSELTENREDGMLERFLVVYPEPINALWTEDDVSEAAEVGYRDLYHKLRSLSLETDELGDPVEKPKAQARRVFGALYSIDPRRQLLADVTRFVEECGGVWTGTPRELHQQLESLYKPGRENELSKFIQDGWEKEFGLLCKTGMDRYKDEEGNWKSKRVLELYLPRTS
jgi:hypothetical protein